MTFLQNEFVFYKEAFEEGLNKTVIYKSRKEVMKNIGELPIYKDDEETNTTVEDEGFTELEWLEFNENQNEIHIMALAEAIYDIVNESTLKELKVKYICM